MSYSGFVYYIIQYAESEEQLADILKKLNKVGRND